MLISFDLPTTISLAIFLFVLAVSMLLFDALLALFGPMRHRVVVLVVRLVYSFSVVWRLWRQAELLVQLAPQLLELG